MPRRTDPKRELAITINDESIRDALVLWISKYHGFTVDMKQIKLALDDQGKVSATVARKPDQDEKATSLPLAGLDKTGIPPF